MRVRLLAVSLALLSSFAAAAEPSITAVDPPHGHPWGQNRVVIRGTQLATRTMVCTDPCASPGCSATVLFDQFPAQVLLVSNDTLVVLAPPSAPRTVDVTVRFPGRDDIVKEDAFTYSDAAITTPADYTRYLIPVIAEDAPGALGSRWRSELTVLNASPHFVTPVAPWCVSLLCLPAEYPPNRSFVERPRRRASGDGAFVYVPTPVAESFAMQLRVRDVSREAEGWGTEVPVVPAGEFKPTIELLDVPTDARYRATLRVYGTPQAFLALIRVYAPNSLLPATTRLVELQPGSSEPDFVLYPAYLQTDPLPPDVREAVASEKVRVTIDAIPSSPVDDTFHETIWAFISLTNNETQQVTAVTPHRSR